jgi:hypothetical protein
VNKLIVTITLLSTEERSIDALKKAIELQKFEVLEMNSVFKQLVQQEQTN